MQSRPSPLQNRVLPDGEIVADPARGMFTGNRGILGFENGQLGVSRWKHKHWIICTLTHPKGRYHGPMPKRAWTPLFFLDEAVALAAGHRPCAYCRPEAYKRYKSAWASAFSASDHAQIDATLHRARVRRDRSQIRHQAGLDTLPDGAFIHWQDQPHLLWEKGLWLFTSQGYVPATSPIPRCDAKVDVLTPAPSIAVLTQGYRPELHISLSQTTYG